MGILEKIKNAASVEELKTLNEELKTYTQASKKTVSRAARLTSRRKVELK
jgi:hypothetical protein